LFSWQQESLSASKCLSVTAYGAQSGTQRDNFHVAVISSTHCQKKVYYDQARNQGGEPTLENFSSPLEKYVGYSLKILDIVQKNFGPSQKTLRPSWCPKLVTGLIMTFEVQELPTFSIKRFKLQNVGYSISIISGCRGVQSGTNGETALGIPWQWHPKSEITKFHFIKIL